MDCVWSASQDKHCKKINTERKTLIDVFNVTIHATRLKKN